MPYTRHVVNCSHMDRRHWHSTPTVMLTQTELTRLRNDFIKLTATLNIKTQNNVWCSQYRFYDLLPRFCLYDSGHGHYHNSSTWM